MPQVLPWKNKLFHDIGLGINTSPFIMPIIIFTERLIAAIKTKVYEKYYNKILLVTLCVIHFTLSGLVTVNSMLNDIKQLYFFQLFLYLTVTLIMIAYFIVYAITTAILSKNKQNLNLSGKYQFLENLKANRSMMVFAMLNLVTSVASVIFTCTLIYFATFEEGKYDLRDIAVVSYAILNCLKGLCLFLAPFAFVWSQKKHTCRVLPTNMTDGEYHFEMMRVEWER
uniref:Serpentine receptor class gamma n=1 Tax=Panagrellus redivivus TaxID=6233 RepID=A0A7E4WB05_PANRE